MGLAKKVETPSMQVQQPIMEQESGTTAAIDRLKTSPVNETSKAIAKVQYKQRDFDQENRGKTKCVMFEAALMSPAIAGMQFNDMKEYLKLVEEAANAGYRYTWGE